MRAMVSFVRASLAVIAVFVAMTASLCVAFTIAISGPPTDEELAGLRTAYADVTRALDRAIRQAASDFCEGLDQRQREALCGKESEPVVVAQAPAPEPPPPRPIERPVSAPRSADDGSLLGGVAGVENAAPLPRIEPSPPERRVAPARRPDRRAARPQHQRQPPAPRRRAPPPPTIHAAAAPEAERPAPPPPDAPTEAIPAALPDADAPRDEHSYEDWANNWTPFEEDFYAEPDEQTPAESAPQK